MFAAFDSPVICATEAATCSEFILSKTSSFAIFSQDIQEISITSMNSSFSATEDIRKKLIESDLHGLTTLNMFERKRQSKDLIQS